MNIAAPYYRGAPALLLGGMLLLACLMGCSQKAVAPAVIVKPTSGATTTNAVVVAPTNSGDPYASVFEDLPPGKGRDPFYPSSHRRDIKVETPSTAPVPVDPVLVLKGIVRTSRHSQAVINTETFEVGETNSVRVPNGKVNVRCLEINSNYVLVQVEGEAGPTKLMMEQQKDLSK